MDYELVMLLKKAGVFIIRVGIESVNYDVIADAKRFSLKKEKEKIKMTQELVILILLTLKANQ